MFFSPVHPNGVYPKKGDFPGLIDFSIIEGVVLDEKNDHRIEGLE